MNIVLGAGPTMPATFSWRDPDTGATYWGPGAAKAQQAWIDKQNAALAHKAAVAKAYEDAQAAALRDQYAAEVAASSAKGRDDFSYATWRAETSTAPAQYSAPSLVPLAALAAAALYFWKG